MSRRSVLFAQAAVLFAAYLLAVPQVLAGDRAHAGSPPPAKAQPVSAPVVRPAPLAMTISVTTTTSTQAATDSAYITLRGPDGQLRRFAVEGGPDAVSSRVVVLRPGEAVTFRVATTK
ncbi:MAG TPA: hypothetical protein VKA46_31005 [Gemmataceae bacterium]|nr:hypothetical protein [Gemmataceae bacterium]